MSKSKTLRGRVEDILAERISRFIRAKEAKGGTWTESHFLREASVEYLDRHENEIGIIWNDKPNSYDRTDHGTQPLGTAVDYLKGKHRGKKQSGSK